MRHTCVAERRSAVIAVLTLPLLLPGIVYRPRYSRRSAHEQ